MTKLAVLDFPQQKPSDSQFEQLKTHFDSKYKIAWYLMDAKPRPCFTPTLLDNILAYQSKIKKEMQESSGEKYKFMVLGSESKGVFNYGGDLVLFRKYIHENKREKLADYAIKCVYGLYQNLVNLNQDLTTVSLIQGDALGGGFEVALSSNLVIAEKGTKMGFPEVLFNLFPGMGAYSILSRKIGPALAERMILSGQLYSAEELYDLGVIDILAESGEGEVALYKFIKSATAATNSHQAFRKVKAICNPISYQELVNIVNVWIDSAFKLNSRDLRMMDRLIKRQTIKTN